MMNVQFLNSNPFEFRKKVRILLYGKNSIITGATGGIGRELIREFAKNGSNIWACHRNKDNDFDKYTSEISSKYGVKIESILFDFSNQDSIVTAVKRIRNDCKKIDVLVNNAGMIADNCLFQMQSIDNIRRVFEVNFFGVTIFTQYISRFMSQSSSIVNISSVAALDGSPGQYEYVSSKAALIGATKRLSVELAPSIRVNCIAPGIVNTEMIKTMNDKLRQETISRSSLKRMGTPNEIAKVAIFLSSDMSSYITGQVIRVDGGTI